MNYFTLIRKTFRYYLGRNLLVALGVSISTAVLVGGLVIGDSVRYSLEQSTYFRLGNITHAVSVSDRYFRTQLAKELSQTTGYAMTPALMLEGMAIADGGQFRVNQLNIIGIEESFLSIAGGEKGNFSPEGNVVAISKNAAHRLNVGEGDDILVRVEKASLIPKNAPFVSDTETSMTIRVTIGAVLSKEEMGHFNLKNAQTAPYNLFISLERLNRLMEFEERANRILIAAPDARIEDLMAALGEKLDPADGGLSLRVVEATGETEMITERVFLENGVTSAFLQLPDARPIITYFVNGLKSASSETPYSFVAAMPGLDLAPNEIILNEWTASDMEVDKGDTITMTYFEIGPLRQLEERSVDLLVKGIVPIRGFWADGDLMPHLPGLSDAGHCREWEAGVPIVLEKIRQKDEDYWDEYKGIPKAFVSAELGSRLWSNRFGDYTAVRFPEGTLTEEEFKATFKDFITPLHLGFGVQAVREEGLAAARGGVDFSELFLGLSFFLLLAAIVLIHLLFKLNLESRGQQIGTLLQLGFRTPRIVAIIFSEGFLVAISGVVTGIALAVVYTRIVFSFLNGLWWDIVRTDVLFIHISFTTLVIGGIISLLVALLAIYLPLRQFLSRQVAELHTIRKKAVKPLNNALRLGGAIVLPLISIVLILWQLFSKDHQNPMMFFAAGGLLLPGLLLLFDIWLRQQESESTDHLKWNGLSVKNLRRNRNRSLTVVILFALGTFLVVSTGANRQDLFSDAYNKSSGAGGFHFFAETSVPLLFDLNDNSRRIAEGITGDFSAVQFHRIAGDDASCLNLNRISNPAILGVDAELLAGRFSFVSQTSDLDPEHPWLSLKKKLPGGVVPAIADQTVIQWGLGLKVGDTLLYQNDTGDTLKLKLIGGTAPSIFQGYLIIDNQHFLHHYPAHSGSSVFLIESREEDIADTASELELLLRDYGWEPSETPVRLAEFYSVTNTYLSIFLALGALGLALGTIGLALVLARSVLERRRELGIMQALGFKKRSLIYMLSREYGILLLAGVFIGSFTAIVSTLPALLSEYADISSATILQVIGLILLNGVLWIVGLASVMVKPAYLVGSLRSE